MKTNKRAAPKRHPDGMRDEYDFSNGERGRYLKRFPPGATVIALDEDVRKRFPTAALVNEALRSCPAPEKSARATAKRDVSRAHLDFETGARGSFLKRFPTGMTLVPLDNDVQERFCTAAAANRALRALMKPARRRRPSR